MQDFLHVHTINELNQALSRQRAITRQTLVELDDLSERLLPRSLVESSDPEMEAAWTGLKMAEVALLARYASLPTLTEFDLTPGLSGLAKEGGTFGVAALMGEVVLSVVAATEPRFARVHRLVMMVLLKELDSPTPSDRDLVDTVLRFMRIELKESVKSLTEAERQALLRGLIRPLVDAMLMTTEQYGLAERPDQQGYILTTLGRRTLLHMFDSQRFIETITEAHARLRQGTAQPSMA
jgi:hypothetical protein